MRKLFLFLALAAVAVTGAACQTITHPNGCVEVTGVAAPNVYSGSYVSGLGQWRTPAPGNQLIGLSKYEDARVYTTVACAQSMPAY